MSDAPPPAAEATAAKVDEVKELVADTFTELAADRIMSKIPGAKFGITKAMLGDFLNLRRPATKAELDGVTEELAIDILRERVWNKIAGDKLPASAVSAVFDIAVRRGVVEAAGVVQRGVNRVKPVVDMAQGRFDPGTVSAIEHLVKEGQEIALAKAIMAERGTFAFRLFDGKLFGRNVDLAGAGIFVGRALLASRGVRLP